MRKTNEPGLSTVISERFALSLGQVDPGYEWHNGGKGTQAATTDISDGERLDPPAWTVWVTSGMAFAFPDSGTRFKVEHLRYFPSTGNAEIEIDPERDDELAPDSYSVESFVQKLRSGAVVPGYVLDEDYRDLLDDLEQGDTLVLDYLDVEGGPQSATVEVQEVQHYEGAGKSGDEWTLYADDHDLERGLQVQINEFDEDYVTGYGRLRRMATPEEIRKEGANHGA